MIKAFLVISILITSYAVKGQAEQNFFKQAALNSYEARMDLLFRDERILQLDRSKISTTSFFSKPGMTLLTSKDHLPGLFCRIELKIEEKSKLAPRFRLGSLEYTEYLEGKRIWYGNF